MTPSYQSLFDHMAQEHGLTLLESEMQQIIEKCKPYCCPQKCPKCNEFGMWIRKRYFERGATSDVWMCQNPSCKSYQLYWHVDHPPAVKAV